MVTFLRSCKGCPCTLYSIQVFPNEEILLTLDVDGGVVARLVHVARLYSQVTVVLNGSILLEENRTEFN